MEYLDFKYDENEKRFVSIRGQKLRVKNLISVPYQKLYYNQDLGSYMFSYITSSKYTFTAGMIIQEALRVLNIWNLKPKSIYCQETDNKYIYDLIIDISNNDNQNILLNNNI